MDPVKGLAAAPAGRGEARRGEWEQAKERVKRELCWEGEAAGSSGRRFEGLLEVELDGASPRSLGSGSPA